MGIAGSVAIELRKLAGTSSGRALLLTGVALAAVGATLAATMPPDASTLRVADTYDFAAAPLILFIPVTVLVAFTSEWTTRSSVLTFILSPRRRVVLAGKLGLGAALSIAGPLVSLAFAVVATQIAGLLHGRDVSHAQVMGFSGTLRNLILILIYSAFAIAIATLVRVTAAAVPIFLVLTILTDGILTLVLRDAAVWFAPIQTFDRLSTGSVSNLTEAGQSVSILLLWVVIPLILGGRRFLRADVG